TTTATLAYGLNKEKKAEIVHSQHLAGATAQEIAEEFRIFQSQNHLCKRNMLSIVLSPTISDGQKMREEDLGELSRRFLKAMELKEHQALAVVHRDKSHVHLHLYVNRIDFHGNAYNGSFIGKRSQWVGGKVAREMGLQTLQELHQKKMERTKEIREEIKGIHDKVVLQLRTVGLDSYIKAMEEHKVNMVPSINKYNRLQGFRVEYKGQSLKGSEVHPSMSLGRIFEQLRFDREVVQRANRDQTLQFMGKRVKVSPQIALGMTATLAKKTMKMVISKAKGFEIEI